MVARRAALLAAPGLALTGAIQAQPRTPFTLGVASGEPTPTTIVLWTRLAPEPLRPDGGLQYPVPVAWEIAEDQAMRRIVARGQEIAAAEEAHSVHAEVTGLRPGRDYWYRFTAMGASSAVGRTRTAPAAGTMPDRFRMAVASCQQYEHGYYGAHRLIAASAPELVLFLGDFIYERSWGRNLVRHHMTPEARTLDDYRVRHALYRTDTDLQASCAAAPWMVTWDDHEVSNDYANDVGERERGAPFLERRAAGYRAFWEHQPLPRSMKPRGPNARIHRSAAFGGLFDLHMLDDRQYRDPQACQAADRGGAPRVTLDACPQLADPTRSILGREQESWLLDGLRRGRSRWTIIAQQTRFARFGTDRTPPAYWTDAWDGYPASRRRILDVLAARRPDQGTPVVLGGDIHAFFAADLRPDFDRPETPSVAVELVGTSITSQNTARYPDRHPQEPHYLFGDATYRGWLDVTLARDRAEARMMALRDPRDQVAQGFVLKAFAVEAGRPRLQPG